MVVWYNGIMNLLFIGIGLIVLWVLLILVKATLWTLGWVFHLLPLIAIVLVVMWLVDRAKTVR